ncbi:MAG: DUF1449 family protein [Chitinivibrionales bacterium]|nr:DUF1449 family protein [Chitinivibrionales bacterium]
MIELFLAPENRVFAVALVVMIGIGVLEGVSTVIGFGFSQLLEGLLPDFDVPEVELDADGGLVTPSVMSRALGWIRVRGVPMLVVLVAFLTFFSLSGFVLQSTVRHTLSFYLPWYLALWPALFVTLPCVRGFSSLLARFVVRDETSAVSQKTFVGKVAVVTLGTARKGMPAEAKLTDSYGQMHYVRVEPDDDQDLPQGTAVLLVNLRGGVFGAIANPNEKLTD